MALVPSKHQRHTNNIPLPVAPPGFYVPEHTSIEVAGDLLCSFCFQPKDFQRPLKGCSACRRVSYCSAVCQKKDWKVRHKFFCPQFQKVNEFDKGLGNRGFSLAELIARQDEKKAILQTDDDRQHEPCKGCSEQIINREVVCEVCYKTPYQLPTYRIFEHCVCGLARYCSDACKAKLSSIHSSEDCATLRLLAATERVQIDYHLARQKPYHLERLMAPSPHPRELHFPTSYYHNGWDHYHLELSLEFNRSPRITDMYHPLARTFPTSHPMAVQAVGQMATEVESIPLTIIAGLEASVPDITSRTSLEIHFVAAASREISTKAMMEEVLHHFSGLRNLRLCYVGPEVEPEDCCIGVNRACVTCQSLGSTRVWSVHRMEYHVFLRWNPGRRPDFVVGFNTGWSEVATESWIPTLNAILALKVPALFTAYSLFEAQSEDRILRDMGAHFVIPVQANKWRGVIPNVNKAIRLYHGTLGVYNNGFWYLVSGHEGLNEA